MNELETLLQTLDGTEQHITALRLQLKAARFFALHANLPIGGYDSALLDLGSMEKRIRNLSEEANAMYEVANAETEPF